MDTITPRRKRVAAMLLLPFVLLLAGCGRISADFEIKDVDTLEIAMDLAFESSFLEQMGQSFDSPQAMCDDLTEGMDDEVLDAPVEAYEDGSTWGCRVSGVSTREDFGQGLDLTEKDGEYHFTMDLGSEGISQSDLDMMESMYGIDMSDFEFEVAFTFPGKVISSQGGEVSGSTVTYTDLADFSNGVDITAESNGFPWLIVIAIVLVLGFFLLLAIALILFFVIRSRRAKNNGSGTPGTGAPAAYGAAGAAGAGAAGSPFGAGPGTAPPAAPQGGQPWGEQAPPAAPQGDQQGQQGDWSAAPQWGQQGSPGAPPAGPQWGQTSPPPAAPQDGQSWSQPSPQQPGGDQQYPQEGNQPPQNPGW